MKKERLEAVGKLGYARKSAHAFSMEGLEPMMTEPSPALHRRTIRLPSIG